MNARSAGGSFRAAAPSVVGSPGAPLRIWSWAWIGLAAAALNPSVAPCQVPADLARERARFVDWLRSSPFSPYAAIAMQPVGAGLRLGAGKADIVDPGLPSMTVTETRGAVRLDEGGRSRALPRGRPVTVGDHALLVAGEPGRASLTVYGAVRRFEAPEYFPYQKDLVFTGSLAPPERNGEFRVLGLDGVETRVSEAGYFTIRLAEQPTKLRVYRFGNPASEESELQIFFRDPTNDGGTYPAGRFVELLPAGGGRFILDFNRSRNPFCAYSSVFPCPVPWPGNRLPEPIAAGERYHPSGAAGSP